MFMLELMFNMKNEKGFEISYFNIKKSRITLDYGTVNKITTKYILELRDYPKKYTHINYGII